MRALLALSTRRIIQAILACMVIGHLGLLFGQDVFVLQETGPSAKRIDVVVVGDGYTSGELSKFHSDVNLFLAGFFQEEPFREYQNYFNVRRIDVRVAHSLRDAIGREERRLEAMQPASICAEPEAPFAVEERSRYDAALRKGEDRLIAAEHILAVDGPETVCIRPQLGTRCKRTGTYGNRAIGIDPVHSRRGSGKHRSGRTHLRETLDEEMRPRPFDPHRPVAP